MFSQQHFWKDGKNGTYYAEFYSAIATALKAQWPHVKFGGPVRSLIKEIIYIAVHGTTFCMIVHVHVN